MPPKIPEPTTIVARRHPSEGGVGHEGARRRLLLFALTLVLPMAMAGCATTRQKSRPPYHRVRPAIAFEMLRDSPELLILDLRSHDEFRGRNGHIRGAKNVPLGELESRRVELESFARRTFLVYCDDTPCSHQGMQLLRSLGFLDATLIDGGIDAWIATGYGTVKQPRSDE